jgi:D-arabinose 1-dehydrogenase-like Zn-dependent alcohol dehydrogenase
MMAKMRAVQVDKPKGSLQLVERAIPEPKAGSVRIKVQACGVCHSDSFAVEGSFPGVKYPRVPGHEVAGVIDAIGSGVTEWKVGQRVGVGWQGGYCGHCEACRRGNFVLCRFGQVCGLSYDGGYADYMVAPQEALALIPQELSAIEAAPLMCAGVTTFNSLRNSGAQGGDLVAILGVGGLGHLAVQFAAKMGFKTVAIARGKDKESLARKLGAFHYIDSATQNSAEELTKLGGAKVIASTVTDAKAMSAIIAGLGNGGKLIFLGITPEAVEVFTLALISAKRSVVGWSSGSSIDSQDTMSFSAQTNIRSMNEIFPLDQAGKAYERMMSGKARFRVVLDMEQR